VSSPAHVIYDIKTYSQKRCLLYLYNRDGRLAAPAYLFFIWTFFLLSPMHCGPLDFKVLKSGPLVTLSCPSLLYNIILLCAVNVFIVLGGLLQDCAAMLFFFLSTFCVSLRRVLAYNYKIRVYSVVSIPLY